MMVLMLRDAVRATSGRSVEITSARVGHVPGRHEVLIDGPHEQIVLVHEARSRRVFADGALRAAIWLQGRRGVYTMDDVISLESP
jgi:4-hydroxy-tetrahydrodipicolinate reductase